MLKRLIALAAFALLLAVAARAQEANEEFFAAARKGDVAMVKAFLDKGTDVNAKTRYGATALAYACDKGHIEVVRLLIERGADVNVRDTFYGEVPLGWAISKGHVEIIKHMLDKGAKGVERVLMTGVANDNKEMVKAALDKGGMPGETLSAALGRAIRANKTEIADMLKKAGATPPVEFKVDEETLKSYAGKYKAGDTEIVFVLKDGKLSGGVPGQQPFTLGAINKTTFAPLEFDGATAVFNLEGGQVTSLTWKAGGRETKFNRVDHK
jgi:ankyrin repeat protein